MWYISEASLVPCDDEVTTALPISGRLFMCGNGEYSVTDDKIYDMHSRSYAYVRAVNETLDSTISAPSIVYGIAIMYTPSMDLLSVLILRFQYNDPESPRLIFLSSRVSDDSSTYPYKITALILLSLQLLLDLFFLVAPADFRPPLSVTGYCKSAGRDSLRKPFDDFVNLSASASLVTYLIIEFLAHRESAVGTVAPLSWFFSSLNLESLTGTQLSQTGFTSHVMDWISERSNIFVFKVIVTILAIARSVLFMSSHPRLSVLVSTLKRGVNEIVASLTVLLLVYFLFAFVAYYLFADCLVSMGSFGQVLFTQLLMLMNQWNFTDLFKVENLPAVYMYIVSFGGFMYLIVLNTYLGVVLNAFDAAKLFTHASKIERNILTDAHLLTTETILGTLLSWPSRRKIIEALEEIIRNKSKIIEVSSSGFMTIMKDTCPSMNLLACSRCHAFYSMNFPEMKTSEYDASMSRTINTPDAYICPGNPDASSQEKSALIKTLELKQALQVLSQSLSAKEQ
jgi:hypothetical protein